MTYRPVQSHAPILGDTLHAYHSNEQRCVICLCPVSTEVTHKVPVCAGGNTQICKQHVNGMLRQYNWILTIAVVGDCGYSLDVSESEPDC